MGFMDIGPIYLKAVFLKTARCNRQRAELLSFIESVLLHLEVGYDLSFSWIESANALKPVTPVLARELKGEGTPISVTLRRLASGFSLPETRIWFCLLLILYEEGSPVLGAMRAFRNRVIKEQEEALQRHGEEFPFKVSLILLLFFMPAAFCLLLYPLLADWLKALS